MAEHGHTSRGGSRYSDGSGHKVTVQASRNTSTSGQAVKGVIVGALLLIAAVAIAGMFLLTLSNGSASTGSPTAHQTTTAHPTTIDHKGSVTQWLGEYHNFVGELHAKWGAGPNLQAPLTGIAQQSYDAERQFLQQHPISPDMDQALETSARTTAAADQFCGDMVSLLKDKQGPLFPAPNRELDGALGAWIDSTVAYFGTCPFDPGNGDASARLASVMDANRNAVDRLVGELGHS
jgi:hypothetical protein